MSLRAILLAPWALVGATSRTFDGNSQYSYTEHATRLHEDLLQGYNKIVAPRSIRVPNNLSTAGTDVYLQLRFFKVVSVMPSTGMMTLRVWWRLSWNDLRLSWDPAQYGNITELKFHAMDITDPETTDIWLPDATPYNAASGLASTLEPASASVSYDGNVFWSRPGTLDLLCRFSGLVMFPYDSLSCPIQVGGWMASGATQGLMSGVLGTPGACAITPSPTDEESSQASYSEYVIDRVECAAQKLFYPSSPNDFYPIIRYRVFFTRAKAYYTFFALWPSLALTVLSFSVFFMSFQVGERLGVGVTLVLVVEVAKATMASMIPVCGEMLWLEIFYLVNLVFTLASLLESIVVLSLAYQDAESILPTSLDPRAWLLICNGAARRDLWHSRRDMINMALGKEEYGTGNALHRLKRGASMFSILQQAGVNQQGPAPAPQPTTQRVRMRDPDNDDDGVSYVPVMVDGLRSPNVNRAKDASADASLPPSPPPLSPDGASDDTTNAVTCDVTRLIFFENLFFRLDVDGSSTISFDEMRRMLTFLALDMTSAEVDQALKMADKDDSDGELNRHEFIDMCIQYLWSYPLSQLDSAATNFAEFRLARQRRLNSKWQTVAKRVDEHSRFWFPATYAMAMAWVNTLQLDDMYLGEGPDGTFVQQSSLLSAMTFRTQNWNTIIAIAFLVLAVVPALMLHCFVTPLRRRQKARRAADTPSQTVQDREKHFRHLNQGTRQGGLAALFSMGKSFRSTSAAVLPASSPSREQSVRERKPSGEEGIRPPVLDESQPGIQDTTEAKGGA